MASGPGTVLHAQRSQSCACGLLQLDPIGLTEAISGSRGLRSFTLLERASSRLKIYPTANKNRLRLDLCRVARLLPATHLHAVTGRVTIAGLARAGGESPAVGSVAGGGRRGARESWRATPLITILADRR